MPSVEIKMSIKQVRTQRVGSVTTLRALSGEIHALRVMKEIRSVTISIALVVLAVL